MIEKGKLEMVVRTLSASGDLSRAGARQLVVLSSVTVQSVSE